MADADDALADESVNIPEAVPEVSVFVKGGGVVYLYSVVKPQLTVADENSWAMAASNPMGDASCSLVAPRMQSAHGSDDGDDEDTFRAASRTTSQYVFVSLSL